MVGVKRSPSVSGGGGDGGGGAAPGGGAAVDRAVFGGDFLRAFGLGGGAIGANDASTGLGNKSEF